MAAPKIAAQVSAPALQAATPAPVVARPAVPEPTMQMPAVNPVSSATPSLNSVRQAIDELDDLSDTQTIRLLERHSPYREGSREADVDEAIRVIKPEDTQSMLAIKSDVKRNAPVLFAVQLDWSVTPFDMAKVPPLAIFNAYTLYTTEANRDGRAWYGHRSVIVQDGAGKPTGILTLRGILRAAGLRELDSDPDLKAESWGWYYIKSLREESKLRVRDIMQPLGLAAVRAGDDLTAVARTLLKHNVNSLPVLKNGRVVGIIRATDVFMTMDEYFS